MTLHLPPRRAWLTPRRSAFTLVELLVSMILVVFIVAIVAGLSNEVTRVWAGGERNVETLQTGRAVLEMMTRELSQAAISPKLQFVHDPALPSAAEARDASSIFWAAPLVSTLQGELCEVGYYLTNTFELKRFFVPPSDTDNYRILTTTPTSYAPRPSGNAGGANDHKQAALWVSDFVTNTNVASHRPVSSTVAGGVLNFFVRCLDANGDPIPWLDVKLKYNSAQPMRAATPGLRNPSTGGPGNPSSFAYTYFNAANTADPQNTIPANLLPCAVELTLVTTDLKTLQRLGARAVPATPPIDGSYLQADAALPNALPLAPLAIPRNIALFVQKAQAAGFRDARIFSTVVHLRNAPR